jgi:LAS superfamily LD-carboxypeptidase LdcB
MAVMSRELRNRQLTGLDDSHLVNLADGHRLQGEVARAFATLQEEARQAGFDLAITSSYRSFTRQLAIWNGKASGTRPVYDDWDRQVSMKQLSGVQRLHAILRFSAIPGTSRHHWGTDLDVYDASAVTPGYQVQLSASEVTAGGVFDPLHSWLDARIAAGESHGFYRPYDKDRGGVAPERWHLSYAPLSVDCAAQWCSEMLVSCWDGEALFEELLLRPEIEAELVGLIARYVDVPQDWCSVVNR